MFNPEHGRILADEYQLLYIVEGKGVLQTRAAGNFRVGGGDMFMLFPGEWHSYMPDESTGWNEYWIGFQGINVDNRVEAGFFSVEKPLCHIGYNDVVIDQAGAVFPAAAGRYRELSTRDNVHYREPEQA